jgi:hypothetical protein
VDYKVIFQETFLEDLEHIRERSPSREQGPWGEG